MFRRIALCIAAALCVSFANGALSAPDGEVLVSRGDIRVTREDFMRMLEMNVPEAGRAAIIADNERVRQIIADIFVVRALAAEARQAGLADEPETRFRVEMQRDRVLMDAVLAQAAVAAGAPDFEKLARERYDANPEQFVEPEQVRASHILIALQEGRNRDQALARAQDVRKRALDGTTPFEDLAAEFSDDPSVKTNHGDLGFFARDRMVKPFADAAFAMKTPGQISDVVETQYGFHIIRYSDRRPERKLPFDEVKARLVDLARQKFEAQIRKEKIEAVRSLDGITVNQEAVSAISAK